MDLTNKKIGKLTVKNRIENDKYGNVMYECICDCGTICIVSSSKLQNGHTKSCGCLKHKVVNLVGMKKGRLEVIAFAYTKSRTSYWLCQCICGNQKILPRKSLFDETTKSCGCLNNEIRSESVAERFGFYEGTIISSISPNRKINKNNTSGIKGVTYDRKRNKWVSQIAFKRKSIKLGRYGTKEEAVQARKKAEEELFEPVIEEYKKSH